MLVYKFGGASTKDAQGIKNLSQIIKTDTNRPLAIVVSAMGKTTNSLEQVYKSYIKSMPDVHHHLDSVKDYHQEILKELFPEPSHPVYAKTQSFFSEIEAILKSEPSFDRDFEYDKIISFGELIASVIIHEWLKQESIANTWVDIRKNLKTDATFREGKIDYEMSGALISKAFAPDQGEIFLTQGFIGGTTSNLTTTLGREGSDYTGALLAYFLRAESLTIWKDVPGILNADPRLFSEARKLDEISYQEAIELAYYGAQVIHPKTIKPLQNKKIPLFVKPFLTPGEPGTIIHEVEGSLEIPPVFIIKKNQVLISISPKDFSFIVEENMSHIFAKLAKYRLKVNLMENSAISFSIVTDNDESRIHYLIGELRSDFRVKYNQELEIITIRHYNDKAIERMIDGREVILQQMSRRTARFVVK